MDTMLKAALTFAFFALVALGMAIQAGNDFDAHLAAMHNPSTISVDK